MSGLYPLDGDPADVREALAAGAAALDFVTDALGEFACSKHSLSAPAAAGLAWILMAVRENLEHAGAALEKAEG